MTFKKFRLHSVRAMAVRLSQCSLRAWLSQIDVFLFDCDGVLWRGGVGVPGVGEVILRLESLGKRCFFVTNNSTKTRAEYTRVLSDVAGIRATHDAVLSSAFAAGVYLRDAGIRKKVYMIGSAGLAAELRDVAGVECIGDADSDANFSFGTVSPSTLDDDVEAVVIGFDAKFCYAKLERAATYLRYKRVPFIATNRDASYPDAHQLVPGGGALVAALEAGSGRAPDVVAGKPSPHLISLVRSATGLDPARTCMVGDRLDTDILFGNTGGFASTLLVLTGVTTAAQVSALPAGDALMPTHVLDSLGDMKDWF
jgi:phosphoglycolate/pyridoxal phosphate phosphatase family enzyme